MITSTQNQRVKDLVQLHQRKYRVERGLFLVEGPRLVEEAHQAGWLTHVYSIEPNAYPNGERVNDVVLEKLSMTKSPQGILGVCLRKQVERSSDRILVILSNDPGNVGTLLRSALAFGFHSVVVASGVDVTNDKVLRASAGAVFHLHIEEASLADIKTRFPSHVVLGADASGDAKAIYPAPMILVVGHETKGVERRLIDHFVAIETHEVESLNAAVAGSLLMHRFAVDKS
jgi:TrmH family RNA methyltransferase